MQKAFLNMHTHFAFYGQVLSHDEQVGMYFYSAPFAVKPQIKSRSKACSSEGT